MPEAPLSDAKSDTTDAGNSCPKKAFPTDVPQGWVEYPVFGCKYRLYVPGSSVSLPSALAWEGCTDTGPSSYSCKQLKVDWPNPEPYAIGGYPSGYEDSAGRIVLQLRKVYASAPINGEPARATMALVAEADGPVRQAFWQSAHTNPQNPAWYIFQTGISGGRSAWSLRDQDAKAPRVAGIGGMDTDLQPPLLFDLPEADPLAGSPHAGAAHYAVVKAVLRIGSWAGKDLGVVWPGGLDLVAPTWAGSALLWTGESIARSELLTWTETNGAVPLVTFGTDASRSAASGGTDGKDLVWLQGEERTLDASTDGTFPKRSIMAAPFTTDAKALQPKRLRSWQPNDIWGPTKPAVGCGYAAYSHIPDPTKPAYQILIVRLADGVSWILDSPLDNHWRWGRPIAMTCKEMFVSYGKFAVERLRRVQLDSLGAGIPPD
ncbi:MAG: hypothetical protein IPI67_00045 [Myxococcales bacterium]|nr:hypothetical protein [Myxococcales bacterium]